MLYTTRAIALHYHKYNDKSIVLKAYTQAYGLKSFFVRLKSGMGLGFFQSATLLEVVSYHKDNNTIQNLKEVALSRPLAGIPGNMAKSAIAVFIAEVLTHALKHEEQDDSMFDFIEQTIITLDADTGPLALAPQHFLLGLSQFLGFYPTLPTIHAMPYFDLLSGHFTDSIPQHPHYTEQRDTEIFARFLTGEHAVFSRPEREMLLNRLTEFYQIHIEGFGTLKSHHVLKEVLG